MGMNHKCDKHGCYLKKHICKFELHRGWYGKSIMPTDADYIVERNANILIQEWKQPRIQMPDGQEILFKIWAGFNRAAGYQKFTIMQVSGYAGEMRVIEFRFYDWKSSIINARKTAWGEWIDGSKYEAACKKWYQCANTNWFYKNRNAKA